MTQSPTGHTPRGRGDGLERQIGPASAAGRECSDHQALWISAAVALILVGNVLSLSRAGVTLAAGSPRLAGRVGERFASLKNEATWESRERIWASALAAARDFPVWGSGFGTFTYIEPLHRTDAEQVAVA